MPTQAVADENECGGLLWYIEGEIYLDGRLMEFPEDQYHEIKDGMNIETSF